jgi:hypothetical protein
MIVLLSIPLPSGQLFWASSDASAEVLQKL